MSAASGTTGAVVSTPPSSPARKPVCPGAPGRVVRPVDYQPVDGVGRPLGFTNMGGVADLQAQMGSMSLGGQRKQ
jgi:hypothetical protein